MPPQGRGVCDLNVFDPRDCAENAARIRPIEVLLRVARMVVERHPLFEPLRETDAIQMARDEGRVVLIRKRDTLLFGYDIIIVLIARRTPHNDVLRPVRSKVPYAVSGVVVGSVPLIVSVVYNSTTIGRAAYGVKIKAHGIEDIDGRLR
jgi:hypothetical protein